MEKESSSDTFANVSDSELDDDELTDQILLEREGSPVVCTNSDENTENGDGLGNEEYEGVEKIREISSEIQAAWQSLKTSSVSWDEDTAITSKPTTESPDWKEDESLWTDEEGAVARPNKAVKIILVNDEDDLIKRKHFSI